MNNAPFQNLLSQANNLFARYEKVSQLNGYNFSVFKILKLESSEVRMQILQIRKSLHLQPSQEIVGDSERELIVKLHIYVTFDFVM